MVVKSLFKYLSLVVFFIFFSPIVLSLDTNNLQAHYPFDSDTLDEHSNNHGDPNGNPTYVGGLIGNAIYLDGNDWIHINHTSELDIADDDFTINYWVNTTDSDWDFITKRQDSSNYIRVANYDSGGTQYMDIMVRGSATMCNNQFQGDDLNNIDNGQWHMVTITWDRSDCSNTKMYFDNVSQTRDYLDDNNIDGSNSAYISMGYNEAQGVAYLTGHLDEVSFFEGIMLNHADNISELWNYGAGSDYPWSGGGAPTPSMEVNTNLVNGTENYNEPNITVYYNATFTDHTTDLANCTLYNVTTPLNSSTNVNLSNNQNWVLDTRSVEIEYNFQINCSNFESSDGTDVYNYKVDTVDPVITTDFVNNSQLYEDNTLTINSQFDDPNLFAYNITIKDINDNVLHNVFAENITVNSITNVTSYTLTDTGYNFSLEYDVWDSHTSKSLVSDPYKDSKGVHYKGVTFKCTYSKVNFIRKKDRVELVVDKRDSTLETCYYETDYKFVKIIDSYYPNHYVDLNNRVWIDDYDNQLYLEDGKIKFKTTKSLQTKSIGDLNHVQEIYEFQVINLDTYYLSSINATLLDMEEGVSMIWLVMLYLGFMGIGVYLIKNNLLVPGIALYLNSIGFDFYFIGWLWNDLNSTVGVGLFGTFQTVFFYFFAVWVAVKIFSLFTMRRFIFHGKV